MAQRRPRGLILSGGPASVYAEGAPRLDPELLELGIPVLGICYGMQLIARELGGRVEGAEVGEFGRSDLTVREPGRLLAGLPAEQTCWMSHRDTVFEPPPGFTALASSTASPVAALESVERGIYGIQFHPEVVHTPYGQAILETLPGRHLRLRAHLVAGLDRRRADRADPRAGRRRTRDLRALGRRGLLGGGAARAPGDRRPAHLRVRRPRPDAQERGRAGRSRPSATTSTSRSWPSTPRTASSPGSAA